MYKPGSILDVLNTNIKKDIEESEISILFKEESELSQIFHRNKIVEAHKSEDKNDQHKKSITLNPLIAEEEVEKKKVIKLSNAGRRIEGRKQKEVVKMRKEQDDRTVFVGNVPLNSTKKDLLELFRKCGKVESIRFRSVPIGDAKMPKKAVAIKKAYHPKGKVMNAYVVFEEAEMVPEAVSLNNCTLRGVHLRVDSASQEKQICHEKSIFIGNLPYNCEDEELRGLFEGCGGVESVRVVRDKGTLTGKGFAYVAFKEESSVGLAVRMTGCEFKKRKLRIDRSSDKKPLKKKMAGVIKGVVKGAEGGRKGDNNKFGGRRGEKNQFGRGNGERSKFGKGKMGNSKFMGKNLKRSSIVVKKSESVVGKNNKDQVERKKIAKVKSGKDKSDKNVLDNVRLAKKRKCVQNGAKDPSNEEAKSKCVKKRGEDEATPVKKSKKEILQKKENFLKKKTVTIEKKKKIKKVIKQKMLKTKKEKLGEILSKQ